MPPTAAPIWDTTLGILRDPIFAVVLSLILFLFSSRYGACFLRLFFGILLLGALVWLVIKYPQVESVVVAIVGAIGTVLAAVFIGVIVLAIAVILAVHAMHRRAEAAPMASSHPIFVRPETDVDQAGAGEESVAQALEVHEQRLLMQWQNLEDILEPLVGSAEGDRLGRAVGGLTTAYFSGLRGRMTEIRRIHGDVARELVGMADTLPRLFPGMDGVKLRALANDKKFLMSKADLEEAVEDDISWFLYWLARVLCIRSDWHSVATVGSKCWYGIFLLQSCAEAL